MFKSMDINTQYILIRQSKCDLHNETNYSELCGTTSDLIIHSRLVSIFLKILRQIVPSL